MDREDGQEVASRGFFDQLAELVKGIQVQLHVDMDEEVVTGKVDTTTRDGGVISISGSKRLRPKRLKDGSKSDLRLIREKS